MNTNGIIFNCIAAAAKVVFNHLGIAPGNYTAADLAAVCANMEGARQQQAINKNHAYTNGTPAKDHEIEMLKLKKTAAPVDHISNAIYSYDWSQMGENFAASADGSIIISVGSFSCTIAPLSVFLMLNKFAKVAGLPSAVVAAAQRFTREESADLVPVCSFAMPCPGAKLAKCATLDKNDLREVMKHICFDPVGYLVASDGHILNITNIDIKKETAEDLREIVIPSALIKNAKTGDIVTIYNDGKKYIIKTATESAPEIVGKYPNWRNLLKIKMHHVATFSKKEITALQKEAAKIAGNMYGDYFVYYSAEGAARLSAIDNDFNKKYSVTVNAQQVAPAVFAMSSALLARVPVLANEYKLYYIDATRFLVLKDNTGNLTLLMPRPLDFPEDHGIPADHGIGYNDNAENETVFIYEKTAAPAAAVAAEQVAEDTTAPAAVVPVEMDTTAEEAAEQVAEETAAAPAAAVAVEMATAAEETAEQVAEEDTAAPAAVVVEMATTAEETAEDTAEDVATVPGDFVAGHNIATEDTTEEEETTATRRASLFIRAAMWLHQYAAALIVAALPLFVLYCISKTETPAAAMMHTTATAAAKIITDAAAPGDTTTAPAVAALAASPADSVAAPGNITTATPSRRHIEKETASAPSLSPDDLAAMYAAYLAAVEDTPAPVLSDAAEETAEDDTTAAAVYLATVHGDFVAVPTAAAATVAATTAPGDLSTFAATPGAPSIMPAF